MIPRASRPGARGTFESAAGYGHPEYAASLAEFGRPVGMPRSRGWVLERPIPGGSLCDAMGCYPLFACADWSGLPQDLEELGPRWVSLSLVADPFGDFEPADLSRCFDVVVPFKERFVIDLTRPQEEIGSKHHRTNARKALDAVRVEVCPDPGRYLDEWVRLYADLARKHGLRGVRAFSRPAFERQLAIPGLVMFRAHRDGITLGLDTWFVEGDVAYGHLAAYSDEGRSLRASYAAKWFLVRHFAGKVRWIDLGGGAGLATDTESGLARFKQGWATGTRMTYFCGRVFDRRAYDALAGSRQWPDPSYFPIYRQGEY